MKKFLYLFFLLPFGQIFTAENDGQPPTKLQKIDNGIGNIFGAEGGQKDTSLFKAFDRVIKENQTALHRFTVRAGDYRFAPQMPPPPPPPPPPPFLFPPIPLPGQSAQSLTDGQQQLATGANSFPFQIPPPELAAIQPVLPEQPAQDQSQSTIILKSRPVQPQLPPAAASITAFSSPAAPALLPALRVSIPPLPSTVAPIRTTAHQNQPHELHQVEGFSINSDGNYQCTHTGCETIMDNTVLIDSLKRHQRTHRISYQCSQCGYDGKGRPENVKRHISRKNGTCTGAVVKKITLNESTAENVTSSSSAPVIRDDVGNEAPFLPPSLTSSAPDQIEETHQTTASTNHTPLPFQMPPPPFLPTSSFAIAPLPGQAHEQELNLDDPFIPQLLSEPLPKTLGISSVMPGPSNRQESYQLPVSSAPQITQGQEVENRFGIQHAPAPLADQTLAGNLDLDDAFIAELLREQPQQASTDDQSQQQPFTVGSFTAANFLPSQITPPQPFFGQQPFTVGSLAEDRIRLRLRQIEAFINSYTYKNAPDRLKQRALADFTASLDGFMASVTQTIGSATSNVSSVDLPTVSTVAALAQKKSFQCDFCEKSFARELILKRHRATDHAPQSLQQKNTSGSAAREDHSTDVSATAAQSDENPGEFDDFIEKFSSTTTGPDGKKIYLCTFPDCVKRSFGRKKSVKNNTRLATHMRYHFNKLKNKYQCEECKQSFITKGSLDRHLKSDNVHQLQLRLPSERSSINLPDKYKKHFTQEDSKIICKECNKQFPSTITLQSLYQHKQRHQQKYQCAACKVIYCWRSNAKEHTEKDGSCKNAEILVVNLTSTAPSASNQQEFLDDDDIVIDDDE